MRRRFARTKNTAGSKSTETAASDSYTLENGIARSTESLAKKETRVVNILRVAVLCVILTTAAVVSFVVYQYTRDQEKENFTTHFEHGSTQVIESFHDVMERYLASVATLSNSITSYANDTFPFVTVPDFELKGSDLRATSGSHFIYWAPLITDETREAWEDYALEHRFQAAQAFERDTTYRNEQDESFGINQSRNLQDGDAPEPPLFSILDDGTNYHTKLWSNGARAPPGDEPDGGGPYLALWQQR